MGTGNGEPGTGTPLGATVPGSPFPVPCIPPPVPGSSYFFAFSNSDRYCPYPSSASFPTGMKRMDAEFMQ